jgi:hypothetical protein
LRVDLSKNRFTGALNLTQLPSGGRLLYLNLAGDDFCGTMACGVGCALLSLQGNCSCADAGGSATVTCPMC